MKTVEPRRDRVVIGDKSMDSIEAEWRAWKAPTITTDAVPAGWLTVRGVAQVRGISREHAGKIVSDGVRTGTIERRMFRITVGSLPRPVPHYRIKK